MAKEPVVNLVPANGPDTRAAIRAGRYDDFRAQTKAGWAEGDIPALA